MSTLDRLVSVVRSRPVERALRCPKCHGDVELRDGLLVCVCGWVGFSLAQLSTRSKEVA